MPRLRDGAVRVEPKPGAGAGDGDVHLAPRREAQVRRRPSAARPAAAGSQPGARPAARLVRPGPSNIASTGISRVPPGPAISARAAWQISAGTASADGAALQMLPPRLARFCTCTPPISRAD